MQTKLPGLRLLTDLKLEAATAWGAHDPGADDPTPTTYVVGGDGTVRWRRLAAPGNDWPTYAELAAALDQLN